MHGNSLLLADGLQSAVNVRDVDEREVADEGAIDFVVAHAAVQPAQEQYELHSRGCHGGEHADPMHVGPRDSVVRAIRAGKSVTLHCAVCLRADACDLRCGLRCCTGRSGCATESFYKMAPASAPRV